MNNVKIPRRTGNFRLGLLITVCAALFYCLPALGQATDNSTNDKKFESYQDNYYKIADMQRKFPDMAVTYNYDKNGKLEGVSVTGVDNSRARANLVGWLMDFQQLADDMLYAKDNNGIYFQAEDNAQPVGGKHKFLTKLQDNLNYPDDAKDMGIEGVVSFKFSIDSNGNAHNVEAMNHINAPKYITDEMDKEAIAAFKETNIKWKPAEVDHADVPEWMIVPITFKLEPTPGLWPLVG